MTVYLVEKNSRYDTKPLEDYGDIHHITDRRLNPFNIKEALETIEAGLEEFDPDMDYICLTGNLQAVSLMMLVAGRLFSSFRVLMFDARTSNYNERVITDESS